MYSGHMGQRQGIGSSRTDLAPIDLKRGRLSMTCSITCACYTLTETQCGSLQDLVCSLALMAANWQNLQPKTHVAISMHHKSVLHVVL